MDRLNTLAFASGGPSEAVRLVENIVKCGGADHLYEERLAKVSRQQNVFSTLKLILLIVLAHLALRYIFGQIF